MKTRIRRAARAIIVLILAMALSLAMLGWSGHSHGCKVSHGITTASGDATHGHTQSWTTYGFNVWNGYQHRFVRQAKYGWNYHSTVGGGWCISS